MSSAFQAILPAPLCTLGIRTRDEFISEIVFLPQNTPTQAPSNSLAAEACRQLELYFIDPDCEFTLPLSLHGSDFRRKVWQQIAAIPRGQTRYYGEIAAILSSSARAVGQACGENPIPIVIPCHRVIGKNGLGGFMHRLDADSLAIKKWLLAHETA